MSAAIRFRPCDLQLCLLNQSKQSQWLFESLSDQVYHFTKGWVPNRGSLSRDNFFYTHLPKRYVQLVTLVMQYNAQKAAFLRKYSNHLFSHSSFARAELQASHPPPTHTWTLASLDPSVG